MRAAVFEEDQVQPVSVNRIPSQFADIPPQERLVELLDSIWPADGQVTAIAVAVPGPIDPQAGTVRNTPNLPGLDEFPLVNYLETHYHVPVYLGNDANLAALGEWTFGAGRGHHHVLYLTISTGIGSGVIIADQLLEGAHGMASELGHVTILPDGPMCNCGQRGHLEALASGTAIASWVCEQLNTGTRSILSAQAKVTAKGVAEAAEKGDSLAIAAFERAGRYLGEALGNFLNIFNPSIVILGGGVTSSCDLFIEPLKTAMAEKAFTPAYLEDLAIAIAELGDDAGLMGALALARTKAA
ncbi:MAG: ROK family protein [Anaerolineales bacterium]|nr:ROK family protein [Anaerolineales bacterium]